MDVLALILACSLHPDDALVRTLVHIQSGDTVLFVGDLSTLTANDGSRTTAEALRLVDEVRHRGGRPAVGLLGIPIGWASRYGLPEVDLFDACTNIAVGSAALSEYFDLCAGQPWRYSKVTRAKRHGLSSGRSAMRSARACILARFAEVLGVRGAPAAILRALASTRRRHSLDAGEPPPERSAIFGPMSSEKARATRWVDASERSGSAGSSPRSAALEGRAQVPRAPAPGGSGELRVLPGPLPSAAAASATHVPTLPRAR